MQIQRVLVAKCTNTVRMYSKTLSDLRVASARGQFEGESAALMLRGAVRNSCLGLFKRKKSDQGALTKGEPPP